MHIFVANERITNLVGRRIEPPDFDDKSGGPITLGHKATRGCPGRRFVPASDNPLFEKLINEFFADFSIPAGGLGQVVLLTGLAPGFTLILIGATLAKEEGSPKESEKARG